MRKWLASVMLALCIALFAHMALAQTAVISKEGDQESADFFISTTDSPIGYYYDGIMVKVLQAQEEWSMIRIGDHLLSVEGYVKSKELDATTDAAYDTHKIRFGEITCSTDPKVPCYEGPRADAVVLGFLPNQAKVRVYGKYGEYYHAVVANRHCFIPSDHLLLFRDAVLQDIYGGIPEIGYVYLAKQLDMPAVLKAYPSDDAMTIAHPWLSSNQDGASSFPVELVADLGDWYQVRVMDEFGCGFMKKSCFSEEFLLNDLFVNDPLALDAGEYQAGKDLKPGLYTFTLEKDEKGSINIGGSQSAHDRSIQAIGPASYTLYIPQDALVRLENAGMLTPMRQEPVLSEETGFQYTGSGMFFVQSQFPRFNYDQTGVTYEFAVADQSKNGVFVIYDLPGNEVSRHILEPGNRYETNPIMLYDSSFVEIENCVLTIYYSHNG